MKSIRLVSIREVTVGWWWSRRRVGYQAVLESGVFIHQSDVLDTALEATADGVQGLMGDLRDDAMVCSEDFEAHGPRMTSSPTGKLEFRDDCGYYCSLQVSSAMEAPKLWLGVEDTGARIMNSRMHLDRATTIELIAKLNRWVHDETLT